MQVLVSHNITSTTVPTVNTLSDVMLTKFMKSVAQSMRLNDNATTAEGGAEYCNAIDALRAVESVARRR